jgi:hypothetical protein
MHGTESVCGPLNLFVEAIAMTYTQPFPADFSIEAVLRSQRARLHDASPSNKASDSGLGVSRHWMGVRILVFAHGQRLVNARVA